MTLGQTRNVLTLTGIGEEPGQTARITLNPYMIKALIAVDAVRQDMPVKQVHIVYVDETEETEPMTIWISDYDLLTLETAVGNYEL